MNKEYIELGTITTTHGIKGELKTLPSNDELANIQIGDIVYLKYLNNYIELKINSIKHIKQFTILGFDKFNNINDVLNYKNCKLYLKSDNATPLKEGQYYYEDLIGLSVFDDKNNNLGTLTDIIETNANDVYEISNETTKILIPAIKECIINIDIKNKTMIVHVLKGLI